MVGALFQDHLPPQYNLISKKQFSTKQQTRAWFQSSLQK